MAASCGTGSRAAWESTPCRVKLLELLARPAVEKLLALLDDETMGQLRESAVEWLRDSAVEQLLGSAAVRVLERSLDPEQLIASSTEIFTRSC